MSSKRHSKIFDPKRRRNRSKIRVIEVEIEVRTTIVSNRPKN